MPDALADDLVLQYGSNKQGDHRSSDVAETETVRLLLKRENPACICRHSPAHESPASGAFTPNNLKPKKTDLSLNHPTSRSFLVPPNSTVS
jgi:hypothetical protein